MLRENVNIWLSPAKPEEHVATAADRVDTTLSFSIFISESSTASGGCLLAEDSLQLLLDRGVGIVRAIVCGTWKGTTAGHQSL